MTSGSFDPVDNKFETLDESRHSKVPFHLRPNRVEKRFSHLSFLGSYVRPPVETKYQGGILIQLVLPKRPSFFHADSSLPERMIVGIKKRYIHIKPCIIRVTAVRLARFSQLLFTAQEVTNPVLLAERITNFLYHKKSPHVQVEHRKTCN